MSNYRALPGPGLVPESQNNLSKNTHDPTIKVKTQAAHSAFSVPKSSAPNIRSPSPLKHTLQCTETIEVLKVVRKEAQVGTLLPFLNVTLLPSLKWGVFTVVGPERLASVCRHSHEMVSFTTGSWVCVRP